MKEISIIVPFKAKADIFLHSLLKTKYNEKYEVILVSDGLNNEETKKLKDTYQNKDIKFIETPECNKIGRLRNIGISNSTTENYFFIDSDCYIFQSTLDLMLYYSRKYNIVKGKNIFFGRNYFSMLDANLRDSRYMSDPNFAYCPNLMINKEIFERIGYFDENYFYGSDGEFARRIKENHLNVKFTDKIKVIHDCTDKSFDIFNKWIAYGRGRYKRYRNSSLLERINSFFEPNLYDIKKGVTHNVTYSLCLLARGLGFILESMKNE
ncbi:MAG: glycosyltransferase family 2 protein [Nanoarchaeota archaeon]